MSPTARSLKLLRSWGYVADICERWVPHVNIRRDLFGGFDLIGVNVAERQTWLVQCTSLGNLSSRVKKIRSLPVTGDLLRGGLILECWGWSQRENGGKWQVKRVRLEGDAFDPVEQANKRRRVKRMEQATLFSES